METVLALEPERLGFTPYSFSLATFCASNILTYKEKAPHPHTQREGTPPAYSRHFLRLGLDSADEHIAHGWPHGVCSLRKKGVYLDWWFECAVCHSGGGWRGAWWQEGDVNHMSLQSGSQGEEWGCTALSSVASVWDLAPWDVAVYIQGWSSHFRRLCQTVPQTLPAVCLLGDSKSYQVSNAGYHHSQWPYPPELFPPFWHHSTPFVEQPK